MPVGQFGASRNPGIGNQKRMSETYPFSMTSRSWKNWTPMLSFWVYAGRESMKLRSIPLHGWTFMTATLVVHEPLMTSRSGERSKVRIAWRPPSFFLCFPKSFMDAFLQDRCFCACISRNYSMNMRLQRANRERCLDGGMVCFAYISAIFSVCKWCPSFMNAVYATL